MVDLVSVTANIQNNKVEIDTKCFARSSEERKKFDEPWWVIGSAAFIFQIMDELCIALVQRTHNTSNPCRWALIPAGVADYVCELHNPSLIVTRETNEELKIIKNDICGSPLEVSELLSKNEITIYDKFTNKTYHDIGDIYVSGKKAYFLRLYKINETLSDFILFDGEKDLNDKPLDRIIALVPINILMGIVCPVKMYQGKKEIAVRDIGLSSFETPTLEWFRDIAVNL